MRLHALTAVTRPENLPRIADSLIPALAHGIDLVWHWQGDPEHLAVGGQALKNHMLEHISDGWCWILDDDTIAHPSFFQALTIAVEMHPDAQLIVCAQQHRNGWVRRVSREMLKETHVDAGQVVIRREAIGDARIPVRYTGDGAWIESIAADLAERQIAYIRQPVTLYNALRAD